MDKLLEEASRQVAETIRQDIDRWTARPGNKAPEVIQWVSGRLEAFGSTAAAKDVTRANVGRYAEWVAREYLWLTRFYHSHELKGNDSLNYWRAIAIAKNFSK